MHAGSRSRGVICYLKSVTGRKKKIAIILLILYLYIIYILIYIIYNIELDLTATELILQNDSATPRLCVKGAFG